jgi:tetratricopeptide (TPR) repeat protein
MESDALGHRIDGAAMTRWLTMLGALLVASACAPDAPNTVPAADAGNEPPPPVDTTSTAPANGGRASSSPPKALAASYVGTQRCADCHREEYEAWQGSHHDLAMKPADATTVVGDFADVSVDLTPLPTTFAERDGRYQVTTDDAGGEARTFEVAYTFGIEPLQQYLLPTGQGRLQALSVAWDTRPASEGGQRWFHLYPDDTVDHTDVLHWTAGSQNWNNMCADCHSTGVRKRYDSREHRFDTTFEEVNVACEACHGPGSAHADAASAADPGTGYGSDATARAGDDYPEGLIDLRDPSAQINTCAPCHSRRGQIAEGFTPARDYFDHYRPALLNDGLYHSDGQILDEVYVYGSFLQSRMYQRGVKCTNCHNAHTSRLERAGNAVCTTCHNPAGREDFPTLRAALYDDPSHHFHPAGSEAAACVSCHMPAKTYMQVDERRDHSFRRPRPDLTATTGVPNACNDCHRDESAQWAAAEIAKRFGPDRPAHFGPLFDAARRGHAGAETELVAIAGDAAQPAIVRATALSLMLPYQSEATDQALIAGLADRDPMMRLGALMAAERWPPGRRWDLLADLLGARHKAVRIEAARLLATAVPSLSQPDSLRARAGLSEYLASLRLNADRPDSQVAIASTQAALGDFRAAEAALREALVLNDQYVPALLNLADLYRATDRDAAGEPLLVRALELAPDLPEALLASGLWLVRQQRIDDAIALLERAFSVAPDSTRIAYVYAVALNSTGQPQRSLQVLDEALARTGANRQLLQTAASIARDAGDVERQAYYVRELAGL